MPRSGLCVCGAARDQERWMMKMNSDARRIHAMKEYIWETYNNPAISAEKALRCCEDYAKMVGAESDIRLVAAFSGDDQRLEERAEK